VRRQMRHANPRGNQEAAVVGQEVPVPTLGLQRPAEEPIPAGQTMGRRRPGQRGHHPRAAEHQVFQLFADRLRVTQLVVLVQQGLEQRLLVGAPHQAERKRQKVRQGRRDRRAVDRHGRNPAVPAGAIGMLLTRSGKLEVTFPVEPQQQAATHGILEHAVGLPPVPRLTDLLRERPAAQRRLVGEELLQERQILSRDRSSAVGEQRVHAHHHTPGATRT